MYYMSQHRFTPAPDRFAKWVPYNRNYMSLTARAEGAVLSRIWREVEEPERFFAIGIWTDHAAATDWSTSPQSALGARPSEEQGLYEGYPMTWSRWSLTDFAWGLRHRDFAGKDTAVKLINWDISPEHKGQQDAMLKAFLSALARHPGFICGETYTGHRGDRYQIAYTFEKAEDWPFGGDVPADLQLLMESDAFRQLRRETTDPVIVDCTTWDWVWGPQARLLETSAMTPRASVKDAVATRQSA